MFFNKKLFEDLNKNEKKLLLWIEYNLQYVIKNSINNNNASISTIANKIGFSPSFISKTFKKIGYYGWKDFKYHLVQYKNIPNSLISCNYGNYIEKSLFPSISNTIMNIDENEISKLANRIARKDIDLYFIGEGFSYFVVQDQVRRYNKIGIRSFAYNSVDYWIESVRKDSIVIFVSNSGYTESICRSNEIISKISDTYLVTSNVRAKGNYKYKFIGNIHDVEILSERELPRNSRIVTIIILDWIFTKIIKILNKKKSIKLMNSYYNQ